jgi:hypothetical protein
MTVRTAAVVAGSIAGVGVVAATIKRLPARFVPAAVAAVVALALAGSALVTLGEETQAFVDAGQSEVGRLPPPMPNSLVNAVRKELRPGETWTLFTPDGRCRDDPLRFFWLAFRLMPNVAECTKVPSLMILYRIDDPQDFGVVVARGQRYAVVRP